MRVLPLTVICERVGEINFRPSSPIDGDSIGWRGLDVWIADVSALPLGRLMPWLRAMREALGMTTRQLAQRMGRFDAIVPGTGLYVADSATLRFLNKYNMPLESLQPQGEAVLRRYLESALLTTAVTRRRWSSRRRRR